MKLYKQAAKYGSGAVFMVYGTASNAASYIDPSVSGIFTQLTADTNTVAGYAWGLFGLVFAISTVMSLVRKFGKKGASA